MGRTVDVNDPQPNTVRAPSDDAQHPAHSAKMYTKTINGTATDFVLQPFDDRVFIAVTQMKKLGTTLSAEREISPGGSESFAVTVLVGKRDEPVLELCARQVVGLMAADGCTKPLLISLALRDHNARIVGPIVDTIRELKGFSGPDWVHGRLTIAGRIEPYQRTQQHETPQHCHRCRAAAAFIRAPLFDSGGKRLSAAATENMSRHDIIAKITEQFLASTPLPRLKKIHNQGGSRSVSSEYALSKA